MSLADYNSFGIIPITVDGAVATITNSEIDVVAKQYGEYTRIHTKVGDKFVIVHARGSNSDEHIYPFIVTKENGEIAFYAQGDTVTNYTLEITTDVIGGNSGYIYFNNLKESDGSNKLLVYQDTGRSGLLHQAVQNELIMFIRKQLEEMNN